MSIPEEFKHRVFRTNVSGMGSIRELTDVTIQWPNVEVDVLYEGSKPTVVVVFESMEDCLAFTLKYGAKFGG